MAESGQANRFIFPKWANLVLPALVMGGVAGIPYVVILVGFGASPRTLSVGYRPKQPIPYSHELHVNQLGMDCRYCHNTVERAAYAAIPPTATCMNCHQTIHAKSEKLKPLWQSQMSGMPVEWTKVHDLPDYAFFNHSAHITKGVSCVSCHGRVDHMGPDGVFQHEPLSMGWCLKCHRNPAPNLRPTDQVTNLLWQVGLSDAERLEIGEKIFADKKIKTPRQMTDCSTCHR